MALKLIKKLIKKNKAIIIEKINATHGVLKMQSWTGSCLWNRWTAGEIVGVPPFDPFDLVLSI